MQRLYSPWRSEYIESFQNPKDEGCIFCNAQSEDVEDENSLVVYKGKEVFVLMNRYPYNNGHLLIIPYRHIAKINEMTDTERLETFFLIEKSVEALEKTMSAHGHNIRIESLLLSSTAQVLSEHDHTDHDHQFVFCVYIQRLHKYL